MFTEPALDMLDEKGPYILLPHSSLQKRRNEPRDRKICCFTVHKLNTVKPDYIPSVSLPDAPLQSRSLLPCSVRATP